MNVAISLSFTIITLALAQILIKKGMLQAGTMPSSAVDVVIYLLRNITINPFIIGGLMLSVLSTGAWMLTLSKAPLNFAYPYMSLAFPLVLVLSGLFLGESVPLTRWFGMAIVLIGLYVISRSN